MADPNARGVFLLYYADDGSYRSLQIDATLTQQHSKSVELTKYPVEDGTSVSDHAIRKPDAYRLDGIITNTPVVTAEEMSNGINDRRAETARDILEGIVAARKPVTIDAGSRVLDNMVMTSLEIPRDASLGDCTRFMASLEEIVTVKTETSALPKAKKAGVQHGGRQPTKKADAPTQKKASIATQVFDAIKGK